MSDDRMALSEVVETQADGNLVREMLAFAADRIMEAEVEARTPMREVQRNGDRDRDTRAGRIALETPKLRKSSDFPSFLEPHRPQRRRWWPSFRRPTCRESRRSLSMTW